MQNLGEKVGGHVETQVRGCLKWTEREKEGTEKERY